MSQTKTEKYVVVGTKRMGGSLVMCGACTKEQAEAERRKLYGA